MLKQVRQKRACEVIFIFHIYTYICVCVCVCVCVCFVRISTSAIHSVKLTLHITLPEEIFTLSSLQTNTETFASSVGPDVMVLNELSDQDLHCLPFCYQIMTEIMEVLKFSVGRVHLGVKGILK